MVNQILVDYFIKNTKQLKRSAGKFVRGERGGSAFKNTTVEEVNAAKAAARSILDGVINIDFLQVEGSATIPNVPNTVSTTASSIVYNYTTKVNNNTGEYSSEVESDFEPKSIEELAELHKIDLDRYKISTYWSKLKSNGKFTSSVLASLIKVESPQFITKEFTEFLKTYKPSSATITKVFPIVKNSNISLILPKQDAHYNKYDIYGDNYINKRFSREQECVLNMLIKASSTNNIREVVYVVGSDQFNSEWTNLTTKGTPQQNILDYQSAFQAICNHEIEIVNTLLQYSDNIKIVYIPGNHDEYVGWHLINWLEMYFRNQNNIYFDSSTENTKYHKFGNSGIMFNHGDAIKPRDLAAKFPIGFKEHWSSCDNYMIFSGDKHTELSIDLHGIKYYRVAQLSGATSKWDDKNGYTDSKAEMTAFVITAENGMSDIYKELI